MIEEENRRTTPDNVDKRYSSAEVTDVSGVSIVLKVVSGGLVLLSMFLFGVVGIPKTTTYGPEGVSTSWSWGHVAGYFAILVAGIVIGWLGEQVGRTHHE